MTCEHKSQGKTSDGQRTYCTDCGLRMVDEPGAIYYRHLEDARRLQWQRVDQPGYIVHLGQIYIGASWDKHRRTWKLERVRWCDDCDQFEVVQEGATELTSDHLWAKPDYIAADTLGVPHEPPRAVEGQSTPSQLHSAQS